MPLITSLLQCSITDKKLIFLSIFKLKYPKKNFDSAPSPQQQLNPQFYIVRKILTTDVHDRNMSFLHMEFYNARQKNPFCKKTIFLEDIFYVR